MILGECSVCCACHLLHSSNISTRSHWIISTNDFCFQGEIDVTTAGMGLSYERGEVIDFLIPIFLDPNVLMGQQMLYQGWIFGAPL